MYFFESLGVALLCSAIVLLVVYGSYYIVRFFAHWRLTRKKRNMRVLAVRRLSSKLARTLNRLDDFLDTWEKLKEEEKQ